MSLQRNIDANNSKTTEVPQSPMNNSDRPEPSCSSQDNYYRSLLFTNIFSTKTFSERACGSRRPSADNTTNKLQPENDCHRDEPSLDKTTASTSQGLFSSNSLWGYSAIFAGISSRLEAALQTAPEETRHCKAPHAPIRKPVKDRSVFGQPEVNYVEQVHHRRVRKELSHESLDTLDSGHSMGSSRASMCELTGFDVHDPLSRISFYHESGGSVGIGSSLESSEAEESAVESVANCSRSESRESVSSSSWASSEDSQAQASNKITKIFMQNFVDKIFDIAEETSVEEKSIFGEYCRTETGRLWFARYINEQRVNNKQVNEQTFFKLVQYFAIVLFECADADDFSPAKTLMNMCFTFYHYPNNNSALQKHYLYQYLKEQTIWRSLRFWNAAFFDSVQCERENRPTPSGRRLQMQTRQEISDEATFQANITFGQLGTFTYNLREFGLTKQFCLEFLRKQTTIANLPQEQIALLRDNIERMYQSP